ncbi:MAG: hypothetical protein WCE68_09650 [Anaerolineales bacterium]
MGRRKLGIIFGLLMITLVIVGTGLIIRHLASGTQVVFVQGQMHNLAATPQNLNYLGFDFVPIPVSDSRAHGAITSEQAVAAALREEPSLKAATRESSMLGLLHDMNLQQAATQGVIIDPSLADPGLVWMVTFEGMDTSSSGPPQALRYKSHEYNVVVDAKTGVFRMAFPLYAITPSAPNNNPLQPGAATKNAPQLSGFNASPTLLPTGVP